jgi:hypothetical protein
MPSAYKHTHDAVQTRNVDEELIDIECSSLHSSLFCKCNLYTPFRLVRVISYIWLHWSVLITSHHFRFISPEPLYREQLSSKKDIYYSVQRPSGFIKKSYVHQIKYMYIQLEKRRKRSKKVVQLDYNRGGCGLCYHAIVISKSRIYHLCAGLKFSDRCQAVRLALRTTTSE